MRLFTLSLLLAGSLATSAAAWEFQDGVNENESDSRQEFYEMQQQQQNFDVQRQLEEM